jgi:signal peptidase II
LKNSVKVVLVVFLVLLIDQAVKIWVKTNMYYGETIFILGLDWARIHFVENPGMAFGISLGGEYGKLALSLFRILAVGFLVYYIRLLLHNKVSFGLLFSFALILAGALGNIIDSAFYGLIFSDSTHGEIATMFPEGGGYETFLHGRVVDMLYFPLIDTILPAWVPFWGGESFEFFKPVFNVADSSITIGVLNILLFQRSFFSQQEEEADHTDQEPAAAAEADQDAEAPETANERDEDGGAEETAASPSADEEQLPEEDKK